MSAKSFRISQKLADFIPNRLKERKPDQMLNCMEQLNKYRCQISPNHLVDDSFLRYKSKLSNLESFAARLSGKKSAHFLIDQDLTAFRYDPSNGFFQCYSRSKTRDVDWENPTLKDFQAFIVLKDVDLATKAHDIISKNNTEIPVDLNLKMLHLLSIDAILKYNNCSILYPEAFFLESSFLNIEKKILEPKKIEEMLFFKIFEAIKPSSPESYSVAITTFSLLDQNIMASNVFNSALKNNIQLSKRALYHAICCRALEKQQYKFIRDLLITMFERASKFKINLDVHFFNICLKKAYSLYDKIQPRQMGGFLEKVLNEMENLKIQPNFETFSLIHKLMPFHEKVNYNTTMFFVQKFEENIENIQDSFAEGTSIFSFLMYQISLNQDLERALKLYEIFKIARKKDLDYFSDSYSQFFRSLSNILLSDASLRNAVDIIKEYIPTAHRPDNSQIKQLLRRIEISDSYDDLPWFYKTFIYQLTGNHDIKTMFYQILLKFLLKTDRGDQKQSGLETLAFQSIGDAVYETATTFKIKKELINFDFGECPEYLKSIILICGNLSMIEDLSKWKDSFMATKCFIEFNNEEIEHLKKFIDENPGFEWILE